MSGAGERAAALDVLAVGAHPDDVELGCGGTLARLAAVGRRVGILHLTRGEAGTRGSVAERRAEAEAAAEALGVAELLYLDCGDGALRTGKDEEDALIRVLRRHRPEVVFGPAPSDRHPDHGRAHRLLADACFYAGLGARLSGASRGDEPPHRPAAVHAYMQHDLLEPSFVVDVTAGWEAKQRALDAYESQIYQGEESDRTRAEPATKVASREFRAAVEGRARHFGLLIGATFGEPFWSRLPVAVPRAEMLLDLAPGGVR